MEKARTDRSSSCLSLFALITLSIGTLLFSSSCAPEQEIRPDTGAYVWPLPPEQPRIRYVKSLWGEDDLRRSKTLDFLAGQSPANDMIKPYAVAVDRAGRIYVADTLRREVFVFDEVLRQVTFLGRQEHTLLVPAGVVTDDMGRIYVADTGHDAVMVFDATDHLITSFGKGILNNPSGMVVDGARGRLYVVSTKSHRVEVFSLDGKHLFGFGGRGIAPGQMNFPMDIAMDNLGDLYVVDSANFRVQVFNREGTFVREFGKLGSEPGTFARPKGIAVDFMGNLYVTDAAFNNVQIFDPLGGLLLFFGVQGTTGPGEFSLPAGIAVDQHFHRIYVADQLNRRVQVFEILK